MTQVTAIDAYWLGMIPNATGELKALTSLLLAELGSVFYSVREKNFDDRGNRRQTDREFSRQAELETEMAKQRAE
jgi:pre-mRNA-splicing factor ATP-dependent RNA helicase DHX38/PRP16